VANAGSSNISAYLANASTGEFTIITNLSSTTPIFFNARTAPQQVTIDPTGRFAPVAHSGSDDVSVYEINQRTGELAQVVGSPFPAGVSPSRVTVDSTGKFVFVPNSGANNVSVYQLNSTTGFLTPVTGSPFSAGARPRFASTASTF
jgi:6-phosphogluconolactonase (cycloisomerase 2 family)